jgi:hypothetical protein
MGHRSQNFCDMNMVRLVEWYCRVGPLAALHDMETSWPLAFPAAAPGPSVAQLGDVVVRKTSRQGLVLVCQTIIAEHSV